MVNALCGPSARSAGQSKWSTHSFLSFPQIIKSLIGGPNCGLHQSTFQGTGVSTSTSTSRIMDNIDFRHSMYFCSLFFLMLCYFTGVHRCDRLIYYIIDVDSPNVSTNRPSPSTMHTPLVTFSPSTAAMSSSQSLQRPYHLTAFYLDDIHPIHFGFSLRVLTSSSPNYLSCYPCCYAVLCYLSIS